MACQALGNIRPTPCYERGSRSQKGEETCLPTQVTPWSNGCSEMDGPPSCLACQGLLMAPIPDSVLSTLYVLTHLIPTTSWGLDTVVMPILQMEN